MKWMKRKRENGNLILKINLICVTMEFEKYRYNMCPENIILKIMKFFLQFYNSILVFCRSCFQRQTIAFSSYIFVFFME